MGEKRDVNMERYLHISDMYSWQCITRYGSEKFTGALKGRIRCMADDGFVTGCRHWYCPGQQEF
jgi:hypothetical protein